MEISSLSPGDPSIARALERDGVVFVRDLLDSGLVKETRARLERFEREILPTIPRSHYDYQADGRTLHQYRDVHAFDPWFAELADGPPIMDCVRRAVPWEPVVFYAEVFPKPPGAHGAFPHQDLYTAPVDPPHFLHMWIPLEDVDESNGGITFYVGTHKLGVAPHVETPGGLAPTVDPAVLERLEPYQVHAACPAGSAALFVGEMIHRSGPNRSDRPRPALVIAFRGRDTLAKSGPEILVSVVRKAFCDELGVQLRADDDFYALGGTDEAAERIAGRLSGDYRTPLGATDLRTHPTASALAALLAERGADPAGQPVPRGGNG
ncbi:phytanoyl-CoA dioxygenase family protein [Spongiactinospora sp. 9N601]|uniref:phytanoyl-CoA dioxygenase family protein n=1 Tax=Spongiactinospora sp. 9N601 TaxID=3375149 RepID=UPI0037ABE72E